MHRYILFAGTSLRSQKGEQIALPIQSVSATLVFIFSETVAVVKMGGQTLVSLE